MSIIGHIWRDEEPLWKRVVIKVLIEHSKVLDLCEAVEVRGHRVVAHEGTGKISSSLWECGQITCVCGRNRSLRSSD